MTPKTEFLAVMIIAANHYRRQGYCVLDTHEDRHSEILTSMSHDVSGFHVSLPGCRSSLTHEKQKMQIPTRFMPSEKTDILRGQED